MTSLAQAESSIERPSGPSAGWLVVAGQELRDIWFSARGPSIIIGYSLLLSLLTYLAASNTELNIIDQRDTVNLVTQIAMALAVAVSLLFSADSISGERERETLESLLLTPVPRREIALGKFLAAVSVWPVMLVVAIPYMWALRLGTGLFSDAFFSGLLVGTLLVAAFASLGMIVSLFSASNRLSLAVTFFIFIVLLAPTQLPLSGWFGDLIKQVNPMTAGSTFLQRVIVREAAWGDEWHLVDRAGGRSCAGDGDCLHRGSAIAAPRESGQMKVAFLVVILVAAALVAAAWTISASGCECRARVRFQSHHHGERVGEVDANRRRVLVHFRDHERGVGENAGVDREPRFCSG